MPLSKIQDIGNQVIPNLGRRNLVINGKMAVSQRATSASGKTSGAYYTVDRYRTDHVGFTGTYSQDTDVPSGYGFSKSHKIENTNAASSGAGTLRFDTRIEAQNLRNSGWDYTNSSSFLNYNCWVKISLAGTYFVNLRTVDGTAQLFTKAFTVSANTWTNVSFTIPGNSNLTFDDDNGLGVLLAIHIDEQTAQSDSGHTLNAWHAYSSSDRTPDFSQKWTETANATFLTTGWQLEVGDSASEFEHLSFAEELRLCQRYFYSTQSDGGTADYRFAISDGANGVYINSYINLPVSMRATPSGTTTVAGAFYYNSGSGDSSVTPSGGQNASAGRTHELVRIGWYNHSNNIGGTHDQKVGQWYCAATFEAEL